MPAVLAESEDVKPWALRELPVFPPITTKLLRLLSDTDAPMKKLIDLLRSDAAFSAEVLRRANSALYGLRAQVCSLQHAVLLLGFDHMRSLALAVAMGSYIKPALRIAALRRCWRHSLATALVAERIARAVHFEHDRAYTAGMLHDIGLLGLMVNYPAEYADLIILSHEHSFDLRDTEWAQFDVDHCEAGAWLAQQWNFPQEIRDVAKAHHDTPAADDVSLPAIIYWASLVAGSVGYDILGREVSLAAYGQLRDSMPAPMAGCLPDRPGPLAEAIAPTVDGLE